MHTYYLRRTVAAGILTSATCLVGPAVAQTLEGEWTNTPSFCGQHYSVNNDDIHISADGYSVLESGCQFTGGTKVSPYHWIMTGICSGEGPDSTGPDIAIELRSDKGRLRINEGGRIIYYPMKCGAG